MSILNRKQRRNPPPPTLLDAQVLRLREWAELAGVSMRTARRLLASGTGPRIVQLSSKRVGVCSGTSITGSALSSIWL